MSGERLTLKWLKNHLTYSWWKYLLVAVISVFGVDVLFSVTAYRPPEDKKIELYLCSGYADAEAVKADFWPRLLERCSDQEELVVMNINLASDDIYVRMQFSTYCAAQQGDVCLLPRSEFRKLAAEGADEAFLELSPYLKSGVIDARGIDLADTTLAAASGVQGVYGIPADTLYGLLDYGCDPADSVLCIMVYNGNDDTSAAMLDLLLGHLNAPKPEGYDQLRREQSAASGGAQIFR